MIGTGKENSLVNTIFATMGVIGLVFTFYTMRKYQVSVQRMIRERKITVLTVEECLNCKYKAVRPFREGDFVYGYGDECPRCSKTSEGETAGNRMLITTIYLDTGQEERSSRPHT
ncbi:MAG: hypothetical protein ACUVQ0_05350 [Thermoproteota archaeon]